MEKNWIALVLVVLAALIFFILLIKKNHKDKKVLFKKAPGDPPDPEFVASEFDKKE